MQLLVTKCLELDVLNLCFKIEVGSGLTPGNGCSQPTSQTGPDRRKPAAGSESHTVKVYSACNRRWGAETILQLPCRVKLIVRLISISVHIAHKLLHHF